MEVWLPVFPRSIVCRESNIADTGFRRVWNSDPQQMFVNMMSKIL